MPDLTPSAKAERERIIRHLERQRDIVLKRAAELDDAGMLSGIAHGRAQTMRLMIDAIRDGDHDRCEGAITGDDTNAR